MREHREKPCERTVRRWPTASLTERPLKEIIPTVELPASRERK